MMIMLERSLNNLNTFHRFNFHKIACESFYSARKNSKLLLSCVESPVYDLKV